MSKEVLARFFDHNRQRYDIFNFYCDGLSEQNSLDLKEAFVELTGHYNARSRLQAWRSTKELMVFLAQIDTEKRTDLLECYGRSLNATGRLRKTNGAHYNFAVKLFKCMAETSEETLWNYQEYPFIRFARETASLRDNEISTLELKRIVEACKRE